QDLGNFVYGVSGSCDGSGDSRLEIISVLIILRFCLRWEPS
ncbi:unnamed protein product, partial [Allacma fusca]